MSPKSITNTYVLTLFVFVVLLIARHNELGALITGQNCPTVDQLSRNTERVADYIFDDLDDGGSGEEMEQERMALEHDSDDDVDNNVAQPEIITDPEFWAENDRKIARRFALRKARLRDFCDNYYRNVSTDGHDVSYHDWSHKSRHFYVGDGPHKLLGCVPLKTGCTSWIYWQTSQKYPNTTKHSMNLATASGWLINRDL